MILIQETRLIAPFINTGQGVSLPSDLGSMPRDLANHPLVDPFARQGRDGRVPAPRSADGATAR